MRSLASVIIQSSFPFSVLNITASSPSAPLKATIVGGIINCERFTSAVGLNEARFLKDLARFGLLARLTRAVSGAELRRLR